MNNADMLPNFNPMLETLEEKNKRKLLSVNYCIKPSYRMLEVPN